MAGLAAGCARRDQPAPADELPVIPVSRPVRRQVTYYVYYTGRTDAVQTTAIRPRVTGYLVKMPFKDGSEVKKGDVLFEIDPRPYQAQLDQALSEINLYKAQQRLAETTYARNRAADAGVRGAVTEQELDQNKAQVSQAAARVKAYESVAKAYRLNLDFCKVTSPIDGMVSRYYLTLGTSVRGRQCQRGPRLSASSRNRRGGSGTGVGRDRPAHDPGNPLAQAAGDRAGHRWRRSRRPRRWARRDLRGRPGQRPRRVPASRLQEGHCSGVRGRLRLPAGDDVRDHERGRPGTDAAGYRRPNMCDLIAANPLGG
jgi:biotin carboxyl carrier protein